jgi:integrase
MARSIRSTNLETRTSRLKLPVKRKPVFVRISPGLSLGYRRTQTAGTWVFRLADGKGGAITKKIGTADDYQDEDGAVVLTFWQAQEKAKEIVRSGDPQRNRKPITVLDATLNYLAKLEVQNPRTARDTKGRLRKHFLGRFGQTLIVDLTKTDLEAWHNSIVTKSPDTEKVRKSKDSANRVLTMVKALLNHALQDPNNGISNDHAWRLVRPFQGVAKPREIHFAVEEVRDLISEYPDKDFANLMTAAFLTGARFGELQKCKIGDFDEAGQTLRVSGKTGLRSIVLQSEATQFFATLTKNRSSNSPLLERADGNQWGDSQQQRRMAKAVSLAKLNEKATFYVLRHSYISRAIEGEIPINILAENCGTSVRMIEKTYAKTLAKKRREFIERGAPALGLKNHHPKTYDPLTEITTDE